MCKNLNLSVERGDRPKDRQRPIVPVGGMEDKVNLFPRLGQAPQFKVWDRRKAGRPKEVWGHAEQRPGFCWGSSAPDLCSWE